MKPGRGQMLVRLVCGAEGCGTVVGYAARVAGVIEVRCEPAYTGRYSQPIKPPGADWRCRGRGCREVFALRNAELDAIRCLARRAERRGRTGTKVLTPI